MPSHSSLCNSGKYFFSIPITLAFECEILPPLCYVKFLMKRDTMKQNSVLHALCIAVYSAFD